VIQKVRTKRQRLDGASPLLAMFQPRSHAWALDGATHRRRGVLRLAFENTTDAIKQEWQKITDG